MADMFTRFRYEIIVPARVNLAVSFLLLGGLVFITDRSPDVYLRTQNILIVAEIIFPMVMMLITTNLLLSEREQSTLEFIAVRRDIAEVWAIRMISWTFWIHLLLLIVLLVFDNLYVNFDIAYMLFVASAPAMSLMGVGSLLGILFRNTNVGYLSASLWWGLCLLSPGVARAVFGRYLFLFYGLFSSENDWTSNKISLLCLGLTLIIISGLLIRKNRERLIV